MNQQDYDVLIDFFNKSKAKVEKISLGNDFLAMQSRHLLELSNEMYERLKTKGIPEDDYEYWINKAEEFRAQSAGIFSRMDARNERMKAINESVIEVFAKYGVDVNPSNRNDLDFPEFIDFPE